MYRVYDDSTDETLFEDKDKIDCFVFIKSNYDENDDDFDHIFLESIK
ncbi:hypothetical protein [Bacillus vallismortis]|nr:hypothetical protein [Bacillus vallismortis]MCY7919538.1 hypothetical protein [Bacillus vallismortis]